MLLDLNVLINAMRSGAPGYRVARKAIGECATGTEAMGVLDETLTARVRITTHPAWRADRLSASHALAFCDAIRRAPSYVHALSGGDVWSRFAGLVTDHGLNGNDIPDAWLAAVALSLDATLDTCDRGFERFPGLRTRLLTG